MQRDPSVPRTRTLKHGPEVIRCHFVSYPASTDKFKHFVRITCMESNVVITSDGRGFTRDWACCKNEGATGATWWLCTFVNTGASSQRRASKQEPVNSTCIFYRKSQERIGSLFAFRFTMPMAAAAAAVLNSLLAPVSREANGCLANWRMTKRFKAPFNDDL